MKVHFMALAGLSILALAGPAMAGPSPSLAIGGRTIAGPGKTTLAPGLTETVYTHIATNTDACATVVNGSRTAPVRITLVGPAASQVTLDVAGGATSALCHDGVVRMDLGCLAETTCTAQWRVDRN